MKTPQFAHNINLSIASVVLVIIIISLMVGISTLIFQTPLSPLIVMGLIIISVLIVFFVTKPIWALYAAVFATFLPQQVIALVPITLLRNYLVTLIVFIAAFSWLLNAIIQKRKIIWKSPVLLIVAFAIWSIISLFWASNLALGRQMLIAILISFSLLFIIVNQIISINALNGLMRILALIGWLLVFAGIGTVLINGYTPGTRFSILGINENFFGIQLLLTLPGVIWQAMRPSGHLRVVNRLLSFTYLILIIGLIAMSGSRGSALSLLVTLLALCLWKSTRVWGMLGLVVMGVGAIVTPMLLVTILERFTSQQGDTLLGGREVIWQAAWNLILDHMWTGVGIGNARQALLPYISIIGTIGGSESAPTHNPILQVWTEVGLPGVLLYLGILGNVIWLFIRQYLLVISYSIKEIAPYFALMAASFFGYLLSWIKGGGIEYDFSYFLILSLLLIPSYMNLLKPRTTIEKN